MDQIDGGLFGQRFARAFISASALVALAGLAAADVISVPGDQPTIQAAIVAASAGDEIVVAPGVYVESIDFLGKALIVRSTGGAAVTTIDAGGVPAFGVRIDGVAGGTAVLSGFTITGGLGATAGAIATGGGITITESNARIEQVVVSGNTNVFGGGLSAEASTVEILDSVFIGNRALAGGGVFSQGGMVTISRSTFDANFATNFGGGLATQGGSVTLSELIFVENGSNQFGGAIYANGSTLNASRLTAEDNGIATFGDNSITFTTFGGGAIYTTNVSGRIDRSRFAGNTAYAGGGVYVAGWGSLDITNSIVRDSVSALGGGVYTNSSSPTIINCTIVNNPWGVYTTYNSFPQVRNTILSGNSSHASNEIGGNGLVNVSRSLINGPFSAATLGGGVLQVHPMLDADLRPRAGSPVIDAGDNSAVPPSISEDFFGNPRFLDDPATADTGIGQAPIVDLGAVEFVPNVKVQCGADLNDDGQLNFLDVLMFLGMWGQAMPQADMNVDGVHDFFDFVIFLDMFSTGCP